MLERSLAVGQHFWVRKYDSPNYLDCHNYKNHFLLPIKPAVVASSTLDSIAEASSLHNLAINKKPLVVVIAIVEELSHRITFWLLDIPGINYLFI